MVLVLILLSILLAAPGGAFAQEPSSSEAKQSASEDTAGQGFPVSLDHIRDRLAHAPEHSLLENLDRQPDFRASIEVLARIDELLSTLSWKSSSPPPPGGLYGYEQQQRLFNSVNYPLMQPYAAFGGGELITLAAEGLAEKYLGGRAVHAVNEWQRARAQEAARQEVARAIADYCALQPGNGASIAICEER
jgi:hypothetical protein